MFKKISVLQIILLLLFINGCSIMGLGPMSEIPEKQTRRIKKVTQGMDEFRVMGILHGPDFREQITGKTGNALLIYYYWTEYKEVDGRYVRTKNECTPIIFENGKVIGVGREFLELQKEETKKVFETEDYVFENTNIDKDEYQKTVFIQGTKVKYQRVSPFNMFLRAFAKDKDILFFQLYVYSSNIDWVFFDRAYDINGKELELVEIDKDVSSGYSSAITTEHFGIKLDRAYLEKVQTKGINIKAVGQKGEQVIKIPSYYVKGFLKKVDSYLTKND